jgi:hypothetical protein
MQFVSTIQELAFDVTYDTDDLYVGLSIYDITTGTPDLISKTLMSNIIGNSYYGTFTPEFGKSYFVFKAVYNEIDMQTYNNNYSQSSETFVCAKTELASKQIEVKKGVALNDFSFIMLDSQTQEPVEYLTVLGQISKDGANFSDCENLVSEIGQGWYKISLTANEMNANVIGLNFTALGANSTSATVITQE